MRKQSAVAIAVRAVGGPIKDAVGLCHVRFLSSAVAIEIQFMIICTHC